MEFTGMVAFSIDRNTRTDLGFFTLLLREKKKLHTNVDSKLDIRLSISTVEN